MSDKSTRKVVQLNEKDIVAEWRIVRKLGEGGCGVVFEVCSLGLPGSIWPPGRFAMKVESRYIDRDEQLLLAEATVLKRMRNSEHGPKLITAGRTASFNFLLMELLGRSLNDLHKSTPTRRFPICTVLKIAIQALSALRELHGIFFVHRDVKPGNFAIGLRETARIYIFDFGLSRQFVTFDKKKQRICLRQPRVRAPFRGTVAYCSLNVHRHKEQGRHDDLLSMMYMLVEFISGSLPWKGFHRKETAAIKETISQQRLLQGCPKQFADIFEHLSVLEYRNRPNYDFIEAVFLSAMRKRCINKDSPIEWNRDQIEENIPIKEKSETNAIADHDHTIVEDPTNPRHLNEQPCA
uniref:Protein kinase domain-containing protein n=1 Tax=Ascaris lumbricoides TaxID=6252 RepID=A0A0M3ID55_ASCLU